MDLRKMFCGFRFLIYLLETFFLYSLEHSSLPKFGFLSVTPLLIPSLIVFVSLFEGEIFGFVFAFLGGLFLDFGFGIPLGIYASCLGIIGYVLGVLANYFINAGFFATWFFGGLTGALILVLRFFTNYGHLGFAGLGNVFLEVYLPIMIYTFLAAPLVIWFNKIVFYYVRSVRGENR